MGRGWVPRGCRRSGRGAEAGGAAPAAAVSHAAHVAGRARSAAPRSTLRSRPPRRRGWGWGWGCSATGPGRGRVLLRKFCRPLCAGSGGPREQRRRAGGGLGPLRPVLARGVERNCCGGKLCKVGNGAHGRGAVSPEGFKHPPPRSPVFLLFSIG